MGLRGSLVLLGVVSGFGAMAPEARGQELPPPPYGAPAIAVAKDALHSVTFSRLILRLIGEDEIGAGKDEYRVLLLEDLRRIGYPALGAENLVFEQDHSGQATFTIGGTVTELVCVPDQTGARRYCAIAIVWELLDRRNDEVVYRVLTRHVAEGPTGSLGAPLIRGAFWRLLARQPFVAPTRVDSQHPRGCRRRHNRHWARQRLRHVANVHVPEGRPRPQGV